LSIPRFLFGFLVHQKTRKPFLFLASRDF